MKRTSQILEPEGMTKRGRQATISKALQIDSQIKPSKLTKRYASVLKPVGQKQKNNFQN